MRGRCLFWGDGKIVLYEGILLKVEKSVLLLKGTMLKNEKSFHKKSVFFFFSPETFDLMYCSM